MTGEHMLTQLAGYKDLEAAKYDLKEYTKEEAEILSTTGRIDINIEKTTGDYIVFLGKIREMSFGEEMEEYLYAGYSNGKYLTTVFVVDEAFEKKWNKVLDGFDTYAIKVYDS